MANNDSANWRPQPVLLGSGGFGQVLHYINEEKGTEIAVKRCKLGKELSDKMIKRWELEVRIMNNLDHRNIIHAREIPAEIDQTNTSRMPLLGMEFCSGGDLRKVLTKPENFCGVDESIVCAVAYQISCGIEYLHCHRIFHRDIKPENIVLKPESNGSITYKIIDLGYAKELDDTSSLATSFVGTLQYLAPELLNSKEYSNTVDYWSFGNIIFELITGVRPFLPQSQSQPYQWNQDVRVKKDNDIYATEINGEVVFGEDIPRPHKLCPIMEKEFTGWLRLILLWDKSRRGGKTPTTKVNQTPKALHNLYKFLSYRVVHVLDVVNRKHCAFRVDLDEDGDVRIWNDDSPSRKSADDDGGEIQVDERRYLTVSQLRAAIYRETNIPPAKQVLLTNPSFAPPLHVPSDDESASVLATKTDPAVPGGRTAAAPNVVHRHCCPDEDVIFLFQTPSSDGAPYFSAELPNTTPSSTTTTTPGASLFRSNVVLPLDVRNMMRDPRAIMRPIDQKAALGQSYCFCKALVQEHDMFWGAFRALLIKVLREYSNVNKCKTELRASAERLRINAEFYLKSLSTDLESLSRLTTPGAASINVLGVNDAVREWNDDKAEVESYAHQREATTQLERQVESLGSQIIKIQQNPLSRQQKPDHLRTMEQLVENALDLFLAFKKSQREGRNYQPPDNSDMVNVIVKINEYDSKLSEVKKTIGQLMLCFVDTRTLVPEMKKMQSKQIALSASLEEKQSKRQTKIWAILEELRRSGAGPRNGGGGGGGPRKDDVFGGYHANDPDVLLPGPVAGIALDDDFEESEHLTLKAEEIVNDFLSIVSGGGAPSAGEGGVTGGTIAVGDKEGRGWDTLFN